MPRVVGSIFLCSGGLFPFRLGLQAHCIVHETLFVVLAGMIWSEGVEGGVLFLSLLFIFFFLFFFHFVSYSLSISLTASVGMDQSVHMRSSIYGRNIH